ncbi:MAG: hypothetical protein CFE34_05445 [Rhodobacteraceae bacterium PARR1]|nr:MAG: hypothetical protein CFE34_05445 [Rhodobacteraceae bacterium PARR1]
MERITPTAPPQAAHPVGSLPHGRGWAVVATDAGFLLRLLVSGGELRVSEAEVQALRRGEVTGEALLERAGMATPSPHAPPQVPIYGTTVSISAEGRRRAGQGDKSLAGGSRGGAQDKDSGQGQKPLPRMEWIAAGAVFALMLLGWMIGVFG